MLCTSIRLKRKCMLVCIVTTHINLYLPSNGFDRCFYVEGYMPDHSPLHVVSHPGFLGVRC